MNAAVSTSGGGHRSVASWWRGRYGSRMLLEIALCGALLIIYRAIRTLNKTDLRLAFANARECDPVRELARSAVRGQPAVAGCSITRRLIKLLNHYYIFFHFPAAIALLLWLYLRHPRHYVPFRNLMAFVTFAALVIHLLFPLAPPRMMTGFVDTMREFGPSIYPEERHRRCRQPDRGDAVAALRLGDDRGDRGDHRPQVAVALADRAASDADGDVDHRHRQPLVDRRRRGGDHHRRHRGARTGCSSCGSATVTGRGRSCGSRPTRGSSSSSSSRTPHSAPLDTPTSSAEGTTLERVD